MNYVDNPRLEKESDRYYSGCGCTWDIDLDGNRYHKISPIDPDKPIHKTSEVVIHKILIVAMIIEMLSTIVFLCSALGAFLMFNTTQGNNNGLYMSAIFLISCLVIWSMKLVKRLLPDRYQLKTDEYNVAMYKTMEARYVLEKIKRL